MATCHNTPLHQMRTRPKYPLFISLYTLNLEKYHHNHKKQGRTKLVGNMHISVPAAEGFEFRLRSVLAWVLSCFFLQNYSPEKLMLLLVSADVVFLVQMSVWPFCTAVDLSVCLYVRLSTHTTTPICIKVLCSILWLFCCTLAY